MNNETTNNNNQQNQLKRYKTFYSRDGEVIMQPLDAQKERQNSNQENTEQNEQQENKPLLLTTITPALRSLLRWKTYFWTFGLWISIIMPLFFYAVYWVSCQKVEFNGIRIFVIKDYTYFVYFLIGYFSWPFFIIVRYFTLNSNLKRYEWTPEVAHQISEMEAKHRRECWIMWLLWIIPILIGWLVMKTKVYRQYSPFGKKKII